MKAVKEGYEEFVSAIIRPPRLGIEFQSFLKNNLMKTERAEYSIERLGPRIIRNGNKSVERKDLELENKRKLTLQCSWFEPTKDCRTKEKLPCLIYCHGNSGSRLDALDCASLLLPCNITLFCFDFSGCGLSQGEYVSLGYYEKDDIATVVDYLRETGTVSQIGLWGRSMGAATSIMYGMSDPSIACMVLDSPFSSLSVLASELVESSEIKIPKTLVKIGMKMIKKSVQKKANFNIE